MLHQQYATEASVADDFSSCQIKPDGQATVLAIGTANPPHVIEQSAFPDFYFNVTNCSGKSELKKKFQRLCDRSGVKRRHVFLTEEILKANPSMCTYMASSLNVRQEIANLEVPKLAKEAALKAIEEWGQPKSKITHLVFATSNGNAMPGADFKLVKLLGLRPDVKRVMLYQQGCFAGASVTRIGKDLAENNKGARVLAVCSEITAFTFQAPSDTHFPNLINSALFGDGAAALILGSHPIPGLEKPIFEIHWAGQTIVPDSDDAVAGRLTEAGMVFLLMKGLSQLISANIETILSEALRKAGSPGYKDIFWAVHPGGLAIIDALERKLKLTADKMASAREILAAYGNMSSPSVLFVLDQLRKKSQNMKFSTTGEGCEWGVMMGFGPGFTLEVLVLKSILLHELTSTDNRYLESS
nr:PKS3 [Huperzia serrata]